MELRQMGVVMENGSTAKRMSCQKDTLEHLPYTKIPLGQLFYSREMQQKKKKSLHRSPAQREYPGEQGLSPPKNRSRGYNAPAKSVA